jgi:hypothetical protein
MSRNFLTLLLASTVITGASGAVYFANSEPP